MKALMSTYCPLTTHWNALPSWQKMNGKSFQFTYTVSSSCSFLLRLKFLSRKEIEKWKYWFFPFASLALFCWEDDTKYYRTRDPEVTLKYKAGHLCSPKLTVQGWAWARGSSFSSSCVLTDLRVHSFLPNCALLSQCIEMTVETSNGPHQALHVLCLKLSWRKVC